jgi:hypothetical protein
MVRSLFRFVLVVIVLVGLGAFFLGYRWGDRPVAVERSVGTTGRAPQVDTTRARAAGAEIGGAVAEGANRAQHELANAALASKIKAKMGLDDSVRASRVNVDTNGSEVILSGRVSSAAERNRAVQLARETDGVTSVVDRLEIRP